MLLVDAQLTAGEILQALHHDEPFLFLGAAFTTTGIVAAAICLLRRKLDPLLLWMAIFAALYGQRLWFSADLLRISLPQNMFFQELRAAIDFLVPIPAFIFFQAAGFMGRSGKIITTVLSVAFLSLVAATFIFGHLGLLYIINNSLVVLAILAMILGSLRYGLRGRQPNTVRAGLLCFAATVLWDNIVGTYFLHSKVEPYGFAIFLGSLGYVTAERLIRRDQELGEIHKELELARSIQQSILPQAFPASPAFRVAARYVPMTLVAGDFYDFLVTGDHQAGLLIADVSGHGVPAALIASMVKMAATAQRAHSAHPAQLLTEMNRALCGNTLGQYVTAAYLYLDGDLGKLRYAAAGHPAMLRLRSGKVDEIAENGLLLGAADGVDYSEKALTLEPGDRLLLYTDGLPEARDARGEMFGEDALIEAFRKTANLGPDDAAQKLIEEVQRWAKEQEDDLTVLVCDYARSV